MDSNHFRLPPHKIVATHLFAQGCALDFWSYLNVHRLDAELDKIKQLGFNTVILLVPWAGFQITVSPLDYYRPYLDLFQQTLDKIEAAGLDLILRLGYAHDNGPLSHPNGYFRHLLVAGDEVLQLAWKDYLQTMWRLTRRYNNLLGAFISWEDFFFLELGKPDWLHSKRWAFASACGFRAYLEANYKVEELCGLYGENFKDYGEIPVPVMGTKASRLLCDYWDEWLLTWLYPVSKDCFPALTMELRIDCEALSDGQFVCHKKTFDFDRGNALNMIYYSPGWGGRPGKAERESAAPLVERLRYILQDIHSIAPQDIFIDQFNFIDNTPGFEGDSKILPEAIPDFLQAVEDILRRNTLGYGLWTFHDVRLNRIKNGLFLHDYPSWQLEKGEIKEHPASRERYASLQAGGSLSQYIGDTVGPPLEQRPLLLEFNAVAQVPGALVVTVYRDQECVFMREKPVGGDVAEEMKLEVPDLRTYDQIQLTSSVEIALSGFYLYQIIQENGIFDIHGKARPFIDDVLNLNRVLAQTPLVYPQPPVFYEEEAITPETFKGLYPDRWMGRSLSGKLGVPVEAVRNLLFDVYVPNEWEGYQSTLTLFFNGQSQQAQLQPGRNCMVFLAEDLEACSAISFHVEVDKTVQACQYSPASNDRRELSALLLRFGFE